MASHFVATEKETRLPLWKSGRKVGQTSLKNCQSWHFFNVKMVFTNRFCQLYHYIGVSTFTITKKRPENPIASLVGAEGVEPPTLCL